jgi:hypothetical protein
MRFIHFRRLLPSVAASAVFLSVLVPMSHAYGDPMYTLTRSAVYSVASPVPGMLEPRNVVIDTSSGRVNVRFALDGRPVFFDEVDNTVTERWLALSLPSRQSYLQRVAASIEEVVGRGTEVFVQASGRYYTCSVAGCDPARLTYLGLRLAPYDRSLTWYGAAPESSTAPMVQIQPDWPVSPDAFGVPASARGPLAVRIMSPIDGGSVSGAVPITGVRTGVQRPDQHLFIFIHPQDGSTNWWAHPDELRTDAGEWQVTVKFDGPPPGTVSELIVGVIGDESQEKLLRQLRVAPENPLPNGLPADLQQLARLYLVKA